jgi:ABC-2 type transport system ATP-binding protein
VSDGDPVIVARGLSKTYSDGTAALRDLDLEVPAAAIFGFLGRNGAGKSTAVRIFTTLLLPTAGSVRILGHDVVTEADAVRRRIGVALQEASLDPRQTAQELLALHARLFGLRGQRLRTAVGDALTLATLGDAAARPIGTYSGGMRRRLDLAAAFVHRPRMVFLDEPSTGLDPQSRSQLWEAIRQLAKAGTNVFLTTQYLEEADALADQVAVLHDGVIMAQDSPRRLKATYGSEALEITLDAGDADRVAERVARLDGVRQVDVADHRIVVDAGSGAGRALSVATVLAGEGIPIDSITVRPPTLEDVYLRLTATETP